MLALRGEGLTFAAIASRLGLNRSRDALEAFHRALKSSGDTDRPDLVRQELNRLNSLEDRIRSRDAAAPEKMQHRLEALERMRERLPQSQGEG